jgi:Zn-dependent peptidase ImmA (M78 family)/DNA-binding XRE family transcriptional regulator
VAEKAYITPKVLKWARETARLSLEQAAKKVAGLTPERLTNWEEGVEQPTIKQAETLAKAYRRPFAMLFLPDVPYDFKPLDDFRRTGSKELTTAAEFIIRDIRQKYSWISELQRENEEPALPFVGRYTVNDEPSVVALDILHTLAINPEAYTEKEPIREWMSKAETAGIFISRTSFYHSRLKLDSDEFQGFAIADSHAPFVFINTDDWDKAQLFTLVHELAHIWIAATGISGEIDPRTAHAPNTNPIERFCNAVAAHALMPDRVMASLNASQFSDSRSIAQIAERYGVSSWALLVRAHGRGLVSDAGYRSMKTILDREFNEHVRALAEKNKVKEGSKGGPNPYLLRLNKNGRLFTQIVLDAFRGGVIQPTLASSLLNTPVNNFSKFEAIMYR